MKGRIPYLINRFGTPNILTQYTLLRPNTRDIEVTQNKNIKLPTEFKTLTKQHEGLLYYKEAVDYLKGRGIDDNLIKKFNIGFCNEGKYAGRVIIPSYGEFGELNFFVGRTFLKYSKPKILNESVQKNELIFNEKLLNADMLFPFISYVCLLANPEYLQMNIKFGY